MSEPSTITRAAIAESVDHWRGVKDPRSASAKALRKAEERSVRSAAADAREAADASAMEQLDRRAGALGASRVLTPARIVQGRATAAEMPVEPLAYTDADIAALRARAAVDDASAPAARVRSAPRERRRTFTRAMAHTYARSEDPDQRLAAEMLGNPRRLAGHVV